MITIHKHQVEREGVTTLNLPSNAKIVDFKEKGSNLFIWVLLDTNVDKEPREVEVVKSGQDVNGRYIKTAHCKDFQTYHLIEL